MLASRYSLVLVVLLGAAAPVVAQPQAPAVSDRDGDGLADDVDACPDANEDRDGVQDEDGCPDPDNDADGVIDAADKCPAEAEDQDGIQDDDGCPEHGVRVHERHIELYDPIAFTSGKDELLPGAEPSLEAAAKLLRRHRGIMLIEVQVHTDSSGADTWNLTMSQKRADAVRARLIAAGLQPARVRARGYGETMPVDSNATAAGRARNRRVDLVIVRRK